MIWLISSQTGAPLAKQYDLVLAKGQWCSVVGKVTASQAESNGILAPG